MVATIVVGCGGESPGGGSEDSTIDDAPPAENPVLELAFSAIKRFDFTWVPVEDAEYYELFESAVPGEPFVLLRGDIVDAGISTTMPLHLRLGASYVLRACNEAGCTESSPVSVTGSLEVAVGYFKASNTEEKDPGGEAFGWSVALSGDGSTLAVSAIGEDSDSPGIDGDPFNNDEHNSGAIYVFARDVGGRWSQQAFIKASKPDSDNHFDDYFGRSIALSADGNTLVGGANLADGDYYKTGAAYVFVRNTTGQWSQQAFLEASNFGGDDRFGSSVAVSGDGNTIAVGAPNEDSAATGIDGDQTNDDAPHSGAVYVYVRDAAGQWLQQAYVKASNTEESDYFGRSVALSGDGSTLAVGAEEEDGEATGIDGVPVHDSAPDSGAVYVYVRDATQQWSQQAYVKASNAELADYFGASVALADDGNTLAVGAREERSAATGIDGDEGDNAAGYSGAVYVLVRDASQRWSQQAYVKASNTGGVDYFGGSVALSRDGRTLAVGAIEEDGDAIGIGGDQGNELASNSGAVYVYVQDGTGQWVHGAYVKASNTAEFDEFGASVALSGDGTTLAVGAPEEDGHATGIGGDATSNLARDAGAVYLY
ncbi:FG-GAP repeat protein [Paraliomyxa miuraensis]|uniref:FG-GAP repeat protein n=1 Tax=Paraliomyxa miuraensis TaxID=376150 RepID=UPI0022532BF3|nr:FG-GAP repeat protein [Paraliomyxa miuraensis]MCX4246394.1 FG-GAP repeat protein [Paraliomyxa miuraensis]